MRQKFVPELSEWVLLSTVARELHLSRQQVHNLRDKFKTLHRLGDEEDRPIFVITRAELNEFRRNRGLYS